MPTVACTDFYLFPDDHPLPASFQLGIYAFAELGGANALFVNMTDAPGALPVPGKGLQFEPVGLEITPLVKRARATLSIGTFNSDVEVRALDAAGNVLRLVVVRANNQYNTVRISTRTRFDRLQLTGGGFEGILQRICMVL